MLWELNELIFVNLLNKWLICCVYTCVCVCVCVCVCWIHKFHIYMLSLKHFSTEKFEWINSKDLRDQVSSKSIIPDHWWKSDSVRRASHHSKLLQGHLELFSFFPLTKMATRVVHKESDYESIIPYYPREVSIAWKWTELIYLNDL